MSYHEALPRFVDQVVRNDASLFNTWNDEWIAIGSYTNYSVVCCYEYISSTHTGRKSGPWNCCIDGSAS